MWIALQITVVGMSLVFAAIFLLWGLMAVLVRLTPEKTAPGELPAVVEPVPSETLQPALDSDAQLELKRRAAGVAVALALASENEGKLHEFPIPPTPIVSAWQAVLRTNMLNKRGHVR